MLTILKAMKMKFAKRNKLTMKELDNLRWHDVSTDPKYKDILPDFNQFRLLFVQTLLEYSMKEAKCPDCILTIAGSVSLTSDYDATVNSFSTFGRVAEIFNNEFEKIWGGVTSAEIFDTNIYAIGYFMEMKNHDMKLPKAFSTFTLRSSAENKRFAYLKCIKGSKNCKNDLKNQTDLALMQLIKLHQLYGEDTFKRKDILKTSITFPNYKRYEDMFNKKLEGAKVKNLKHMNKKYIEKVNLIEKYYKSAGRWKSIDIQKYKDMIGHAMIFGNETYFTQGAFFHVVGILQLKIPSMTKIITKNELVHSIIENYSYLYMEYQQAKDKYYFIALSAKYLVRILDAIERIKGEPNKYNDLKKKLMIVKGARRKAKHTNADQSLIKLVMRALEIDDKTPNNDMFEIMIGLTNFINKYLDEFPFVVSHGESIDLLDYELDDDDDSESVEILSSGDIEDQLNHPRSSLMRGQRVSLAKGGRKKIKKKIKKKKIKKRKN